ncbi:uncharacterized protein CC84DRAFT_1158379 [Paraphaeosphaeria sporulosa]|uniref:Uncharacterized protein n=1 Tax=Paraphaeosphaeria sporulosa TaxID=1460663 RepID=A0A177BUF8_9PLEO|nr:uncharacterized protein CC84DRAFT_1158379 [Paraphaeosphaeria sporulosa]OAF98775.1 hypothetical protein CC84DRAFT_1158379 [Paraphaeosphaeria sporulosa]
MSRVSSSSKLLTQFVLSIAICQSLISVSNAQYAGNNGGRFGIYGFKNGTLPHGNSYRVRGCVEQPNYRGSFDILWVSLVSIGISTYTMLYLNVPAPTDTWIQLVGRRVLWMILGIIRPEFPLNYAAGQWTRAKHSVKAFRDLGYKHTSSHTNEEMAGKQDWDLNPLDFVDENGSGYSANLQAFMKMPVIPPTCPIQRIPNDRFLTNPYGS